MVQTAPQKQLFCSCKKSGSRNSLKSLACSVFFALQMMLGSEDSCISTPSKYGKPALCWAVAIVTGKNLSKKLSAVERGCWCWAGKGAMPSKDGLSGSTINYAFQEQLARIGPLSLSMHMQVRRQGIVCIGWPCRWLRFGNCWFQLHMARGEACDTAQDS